MPQKNYTLYEVVCPSCGALNRYELPPVNTRFEGKPQPIWANNRRLEQGERSFPCRNCHHPIPIGS